VSIDPAKGSAKVKFEDHVGGRVDTAILVWPISALVLAANMPEPEPESEPESELDLEPEPESEPQVESGSGTPALMGNAPGMGGG
jgi:hypothetical protein